jgi:hypothetical protein
VAWKQWRWTACWTRGPVVVVVHGLEFRELNRLGGNWKKKQKNTTVLLNTTSTRKRELTLVQRTEQN